MKKITVFSVIIFMLAQAGACFAVDLAAVDRVAVFMSKSQVLSILGKPDETILLNQGLKIEVYRVASAAPLLRCACIYDEKEQLMGQSFMFEGHTAASIVERLKKHGFTPIPAPSAAPRLAGFDDDTGRPLVAVIDESDNLTTVTTFDKAFYEAYAQ